jgi:hypothetical protein
MKLLTGTVESIQWLGGAPGAEMEEEENGNE